MNNLKETLDKVISALSEFKEVWEKETGTIQIAENIKTASYPSEWGDMTGWKIVMYENVETDEYFQGWANKWVKYNNALCNRDNYVWRRRISQANEAAKRAGEADVKEPTPPDGYKLYAPPHNVEVMEGDLLWYEGKWNKAKGLIGGQTSYPIARPIKKALSDEEIIWVMTNKSEIKKLLSYF